MRSIRKTQFSLLLLALLAVATVLTGCGEEKKVISFSQNADNAVAEKDFASSEKFVVAIMDEQPVIESSYLWLSGLCGQLADKGFFDEAVDLSKAPKDFEGLYNYVMENNRNGKVVFDDTLYLLSEDLEEAYARELSDKAASGAIDLIAVTGTYPGTFVKANNIGAPLIVSFASDPIASGIIDSIEDTGNENIWALVETDAYSRQLETYARVFGLNNIGVLSTSDYDDIAGGPEYDSEAAKIGITLQREFVSIEEMESDNAGEIYCQHVQSLLDKGVDSIIILYGVLDGTNAKASDVLDTMAGLKVPYLISDGDDNVRNGGMMLISFYNYTEYGRQAATVIEHAMRGEKVGDQKVKYVSTPRIVYNITSAKKLGIENKFELLQSVDDVYK